ncbi:MAG TPA: magnesium transporter [Candidatus Polarisedimenticolia bacterium]|nr:magnesium transporter [Candidatus Polarisedimenticolia bacterium]
MIGNLLQPELVDLIAKRDFAQLRTILCDFAPADIAEIFFDLKPDDEAVCLRILPNDVAAEVFEYLPVDDQEKMLHALGTEKVAQILNDIAPDDRTALLEELPSAATQKLLALLQPEERKIATDLLGYPKGSIGRRMTPHYVAIQQNWTVSEVLAHLRTESDKSAAFNQLYVVDSKGHLVDYVKLRSLVAAPLQMSVLELLENQQIFLRASDDQETAVAAFKKYDSTILPVVDSKDVLVGVVTVDDVLDVAEREATEDIQKLGGVEALDAPYLKIDLMGMVRKRAPWLVILFLSEMLTSTAMTFFQDEISRAIVLVLFLPLIMSSGGNSGSQATSLIIRAMALGEVTLAHWWKVMRKEIFSGFLLGAILGVIGFFRIIAWHFAFHMYGVHWALVAVTIMFSLVGVVLWGTLSGSMLPFLLKRVGLDPAASSAPFVATLVDVTGIVIYFHVAMLTLGGNLLAKPPQGVKPLDYKQTPDAIADLLSLTDDWEVEKVDLNTNTDVLMIVIKESSSFAKGVECDKCGGPLEIYGHEKPQIWSYPDTLGHHTQIECSLPQVKCKKCGAIPEKYPVKLPWVEKGKLIEPQARVEPQKRQTDFVAALDDFFLKPLNAYLGDGVPARNTLSFSHARIG